MGSLSANADDEVAAAFFSNSGGGGGGSCGGTDLGWEGSALCSESQVASASGHSLVRTREEPARHGAKEDCSPPRLCH